MKTTVTVIKCVACAGPLPLLKAERVKCEYCGCTNLVTTEGKITIAPPPVYKVRHSKPAPTRTPMGGWQIFILCLAGLAVGVSVIVLGYKFRRKHVTSQI